MTEKDMEDQIAAAPDRFLDEPGLTLLARQFAIGSYRFDLLFTDRHGGQLIVEIQRGKLDRVHTYKILDYYFEYRDANPTEFIDVMVVANQIPAERKRRLADFGIAFRELPESMFTSNAASLLSAADVATARTERDIKAGDSTELDQQSQTPEYHFKSLGPSAFIESVREAIRRDDALGPWRLGGKSSLTACFEPIKNEFDKQLGRGLYPQLWMERPKNGMASCKFEIAYAIPSLAVEENATLRDSIADSIRSAISNSDWPEGVSFGSGSTVVRFSVAVDAIKRVADDTPEVAAFYSTQIGRIVDFARRLNELLLGWAASPNCLSWQYVRNAARPTNPPNAD